MNSTERHQHILSRLKVNPDIAVDENLGYMARGVDPQLERAIAEVKTLMKTKEYKKPQPPTVEERGI